MMLERSGVGFMATVQTVANGNSIFYRSKSDDNTSNIYPGDTGVWCGPWGGAAGGMFRQGYAPCRSARSSTCHATANPCAASSRSANTYTGARRGSRTRCWHCGQRANGG
jgi:hypothetical protein